MRATSNYNALRFVTGILLIGVLVWPFCAWAVSYNDCIRNNESKGYTASVMNDFGYVGLYQFGVQAAMDGGLCTTKPYTEKYGIVKGKRAPIQDWSQCDFNGPIAKKYGINSVSDLQNSSNAATAQEAAQNKFNDKIDGYVDKYSNRIGETINGVKITEDSLRALYHLKGNAGLTAFMSGADPTDGNGKHMSDYAKCMQACMDGTGTGKCEFSGSTTGGANAFCV